MKKLLLNFIRRLLGTQHLLLTIHEINSDIKNLLKLSSQQQVPQENMNSHVKISFLDYPALRTEHIRNAKLYANREDMIRSFKHLEGKTIAEVGVLQGYFSETMIDALKPKEFVAIDLFDIHLSDHPWAKKMAEPFNGKTHLEFYKGQFSGSNIRIVQGDSSKCLGEFPDDYFDMIYIDGDHRYEGVKSDADVAVKKIKKMGCWYSTTIFYTIGT